MRLFVPKGEDWRADPTLKDKLKETGRAFFKETGFPNYLCTEHGIWLDSLLIVDQGGSMRLCVQRLLPCSPETNAWVSEMRLQFTSAAWNNEST